MSKVISIIGIDAINLTDMKGAHSYTPTDDGIYAVTLESDVTYSYFNAPLNQAFVFNTAPLDTADSDKWNFVISVKQGVTVTGKKGKPIYVFLVDQVNSLDNMGTATITFTKI
jgi:hypothetical protein